MSTETAPLSKVRVEPVVGQDDLPGELELAYAISRGKWPHTMDAEVWAEEFMKRFKGKFPDDGTMIAWFANAIMAGYDTAMMRAKDGVQNDDM